MKLKLVTLKTTQTLIGEVDCNDKDEIIIKQPVQVIVQPTKEGTVMGFAPFLEFKNYFPLMLYAPLQWVIYEKMIEVTSKSTFNSLF